MNEIASTMPSLGTPLPAFELEDTMGNAISSAFFRGQPLLVVFLANDCPYVQHILDPLLALVQEYQQKKVNVVGINSNAHDDASAESYGKMQEFDRKRGFTFRYLCDSTQEIAKAFKASCTPDFFVFDRAGKLFYRGQFDDSRPDNDIPPTGSDLRAALEAVRKGDEPPGDQQPAHGSPIQWRPENEPAYARNG